MSRYKIRSLAGAFLFLSGSIAQAEVKYVLTDLGGFGGTVSAAGGVNDAGDVVGVSTTPDFFGHGFLYRNGVLSKLQPPALDRSYTAGINASGQVVVVANSGDKVQSYVYQDGRYTNIGNLGQLSTFAEEINDRGEVVGSAKTSTKETHAFIYTGGSIQDLGTLGGSSPAPKAINNSGVITGWHGVQNSSNGEVETHGFRYDNGVLSDLGKDVFPLAINNSGDIVGNASSIGSFIIRNGVLAPLGGLTAYGMNNLGAVVGIARASDFSLHAALYTDAGPIDLNTLIAPHPELTLIDAIDISDSGLIVGTAQTPTGETHAYLLTPTVPEPAALSIAALGCALLLRRRQ